MEEAVHRLFNAIEPGTYIRPHRHLTPPKVETAIAVAGRLGVLVFDLNGREIERRTLAPAEETFGMQFEPGTWHSMVALETGTVFYETKEGPYIPIDREDLASWAPEEGTSRAAMLEESWRASFDSSARSRNTS
jgi:cupin fold WbuC family metalloprotein